MADTHKMQITAAFHTAHYDIVPARSVRVENRISLWVCTHTLNRIGEFIGRVRNVP